MNIETKRVGSTLIAIVTLLNAYIALVACTPTTAQFQAGQLFCAKAGTVSPLTVALTNAVGIPVIVTGLASSVVAAACQAWAADAVPVTPPAAPVPVVAAPVASAPVKTTNN